MRYGRRIKNNDGVSSCRSIIIFREKRKKRRKRIVRMKRNVPIFTKRFTIMFILMRYKFASDRRAGLYASKSSQRCKASWKSRLILHMYEPAFSRSREEYRLNSRAIEYLEREGVRGSAIKIRDSSCKLLSFPPLPSNETLITISSNNDIERWKWIFFFFLLHRGHSVTELERTGCASAEERAYLKAENGGWDAKSKEKENVENLPNLCTIFLKKNSLKGGTVRGSRSWGTETY